MNATPDSRALRRRRQNARLALLKRRTAVASALGFAALFGLVTQHVVKGASAGTAAAPSRRSGTASSSVPFFDANPSGFAFDEGSESAQPQSGASSPPPPVAQTSVS
jgi:hypothetical protein